MWCPSASPGAGSEDAAGGYTVPFNYLLQFIGIFRLYNHL